MTKRKLSVAASAWLLVALTPWLAQGQTKRVLVVGDSWAQQSSSRWQGQFNGNGWSAYGAVNSGVAGMTAALLNTPSFLSSQISSPLAANPTIDMVHLSIGGNDFLGSWKASDDPGTAAAKFASIQANVQGIVNHILAIRPDLQVTISSYDYLNFVDNVNPFGNSQNQANFLLWNNMGLPTAGQLNRALFGDAGGGMEDYKEGVSSGNSRVHYYSIQGFNQIAGGGWGGLYGIDFPTPTNRMGNSGQDAIHLNSAGYDLWIDNGFNNIYNNLFAGPGVSTNPGNGGTLSVGNVLVGQAGSVNASAINTGLPGSRLAVTFGAATGEFSGGSGVRYSFVDQGAGGDNLLQNYTYTPTTRGADSQGITITTSAGNRSFTLAGTGVAPVNQVATADAGPTRIGTTGSASVTVTNVGDGNLSGQGAASNLQGSVGAAVGTSEFSGGGVGISLGDGANQAVAFAYAPTDRGLDSASVTVAFSNGNTNGTNTAQNVGVSISGRGVGPDFQISNSLFNFGNVAVGSTGNLTGSVTNASTDFNGGNVNLTNLTLLSASITGLDAGMFSLNSFTPGSVLGQSGALPFSIDFNPTGGAGTRNAVLTFYTDQGAPFGASGQSFSVNLTGEGTSAGPTLSVSSTENSHLVNFDAAGNPSVFGTAPNLIRPFDVTHDAAGNRYVAEAALNRIVKYDSAGVATVFADIGDGLIIPVAVTADGGGNLFVANYLNNTVVRLDAGGNPTLYSDAARGIDRPIGIAVNGAGEVFVAEVDNRVILKLDGAGNATVFADAADGLFSPVGIAFDDAGNLFVADAVISKIFKFDSAGNGSVFADIGDGVFFPVGLAFDPDSNLFVSNYVSDQIIKLSPLGVGSLFADAADGIDGPWGLDMLGSLGFSLEAGLRVAAVPEASSLALALCSSFCFIVLWRRR